MNIDKLKRDAARAEEVYDIDDLEEHASQLRAAVKLAADGDCEAREAVRGAIREMALPARAAREVLRAICPMSEEQLDELVQAVAS